MTPRHSQPNATRPADQDYRSKDVPKKDMQAGKRTSRERTRLTPRKWAFCLLALGVVVLAVASLALLLGVRPVRLGMVLTSGSLDHTIVAGVRLPRLVLGLLVGGALGGAGATLQAILRNPLADPFVLGVSGGAALGATLAILAATLLSTTALGQVLTGADTLAIGESAEAGGWYRAVPISLAAAVGALTTTMLMLWIARPAGRLDPHALLLAGVVFNAFAAAVILFLRTLVTPEQAHALLPWLVGTLAHKPWSHIAVGAVIVIAGIGFLVANASKLNFLSLGEESAASLGVDVDRTRLELVVVISLMIGATVSLAGLVGFVGLVVPHMLRLVLGPDHRLLLPASILGGAAFLACCDLAARLAFIPVGTEPPVGAVTALIGAPLFLVLLRRGSSRRAR